MASPYDLVKRIASSANYAGSQFGGTNTQKSLYDWGGIQGSYVDPTSGRVYFGTSDYNSPGNPKEFAPEFYRDPWGGGNDRSTASAGYGYIDPKSGQIYYSTKDPVAGDGKYDSYANVQNTQYDAKTDYGLGPSSSGVVVVQRDAGGTPTAYYAGTPGGGGKVFTDLTQAQQAAQGYGDWYASQHPTQQTAAATTEQTPGTTSPGLLMTPGAGEKYFDSTKDFYTQPTNTQSALDSLPTQTNTQKAFDAPSQPTNAEQTWNQYSGTFANPNYLSSFYKNAEGAAQRNLEARASAGGWGGSSAATRSRANLGALYADAAAKGMEGFASTGMGLASAADSAKNAGINTRMGAASSADAASLYRVNAANSADNANLAKVSGGQVAAGNAQAAETSRLTGGLNSATSIAQDMSTLVSTGMSAANAQKFQAQLSELQLKVQAGQVDAQNAYAQAQNLASSMGAIQGSVLNYMLFQKFGAGATGAKA